MDWLQEWNNWKVTFLGAKSVIEECPKCGHEHEFTIDKEIVVICVKCGETFVLSLN